MPQFKVDIDCLKTTEAGQDEIYFIVVARSTFGVTRQMRIPGPGAHFDMNDNGNNGHVQNVVIDNVDIPDGGTITYLFLVMEEDGGLDWANTASDLLSQNGDPFSLVGAAILGVLGALGNSDDYPGSFTASFNNSSGAIKASYQAKDRIFQQDPAFSDPPLSHPTRQRFRMNGDGSTYHVTCYFE